MMKYLLVEDERFAYEEMKRMMEKLRPDYQLEAWTATVEQTVQFLKHHPVDLMLLDIRLTDGNSFILAIDVKRARHLSRYRSRRLLFLLLPMMSMPYRHSR